MTNACLLVAIWLLCGAVLRNRFGVFDRIYLPPSVIAGFIGLATLQSLGYVSPVVANFLETAESTLRQWPGTLIAVVFAGMLLPRVTASWKQSARAVGQEGLMVWIIVLGQTAVGLLITWLLIQPFFDVPDAFGMLLETGFAGGHGTAAAMGQVFDSPAVQMPVGLDLGLLMATVGLVYGTLSGIVWINLAARLGWVNHSGSGGNVVDAPNGSAAQAAREGPSQQAVDFSRGFDPLLLQCVWLAIALAIGILLQSAVGAASAKFDDAISVAAESKPAIEAAAPTAAASSVDSKLSITDIFGSFPLFIYTLAGGLLVRKSLKAASRESLIDAKTISRLTSIAMDLLVVAAIATLNLAAVAELLVPFSLLVLGGMIWTAICLLVISRRVLPGSHWFELGLINYGMSTGTTATGFVLLRIIDPELKTDAARDYALAAPLSAPFVGGGMLTIAIPLVLLPLMPIAISASLLTIIVIALIAVAVRTR